MIARRSLLLAGAAGLAVPALVRPASAQAVTLRMHHFLPAVSNVHRHFLAPWAQKIQNESQGNLRIQIFPSMQLGGAPTGPARRAARTPRSWGSGRACCRAASR